MATIKITFIDNTVQTFLKDELTVFTIDDKNRIVYVIYPHVIVRIPFENIKTIEENRKDE